MIDFKALRKKVKDARINTESASSEGNEVATVSIIRGKLAHAEDDSDRFELMGMIAEEYARSGHFAEERNTIRSLISEFPDMPLAYITYSSYLRNEGGLDAALQIAEAGLEKSKAKKSFVRSAYNNLARVAREAGQYELLESILNRPGF